MSYETASSREEFSREQSQKRGAHPHRSSPAAAQPSAGLHVGSAYNPAEAEADRVASLVTGVSRQAQTPVAGIGETPDFSNVQRSLSDDGARMGEGFDLAGSFRSELASSRKTKMSPYLNSMFQSKLGADFSGINIHTDEKSNELTSGMGASAFTLGKDIYFGDGAYTPGSSEGNRLLAHELTHTIQQGAVPQRSDSTVPVQQSASSGTVMRDFLGFGRRYRKAVDERNSNAASYNNAGFLDKLKWNLSNPIAAVTRNTDENVMMTALRKARATAIEKAFVTDALGEKDTDTPAQKAEKAKARENKAATEARIKGYQDAAASQAKTTRAPGKSLVGTTDRDKSAKPESEGFLDKADTVADAFDAATDLPGGGADLIAGIRDVNLQGLESLNTSIGIGASGLGTINSIVGTYSSGRDMVNRFKQGNTSGGFKKMADMAASGTAAVGSGFAVADNFAKLSGVKDSWMGTVAAWGNIASGSITAGTASLKFGKEVWKLSRNSHLQSELKKQLQTDDPAKRSGKIAALEKAIADEEIIVKDLEKAFQEIADSLAALDIEVEQLQNDKAALEVRKKAEEDKSSPDDAEITKLDAEIEEIDKKLNSITVAPDKNTKSKLMTAAIAQSLAFSNLSTAKKELAEKQEELNLLKGTSAEMEKKEMLMALNRMRKNAAKGNLVSSSFNIAKGGISIVQGILSLTGATDTVGGKIASAVLTAAGIGIGLAGGKISDMVKSHYQKVEVNKSLNVDEEVKQFMGGKGSRPVIPQADQDTVKPDAKKAAISMKNTLGKQSPPTGKGATPTYSQEELNSGASAKFESLASKILGKPVSETEAKRIILKRKGYASGTKREAFQDLAQSRIDKLMDMTDPQKDAEAKKTRSALGMSSKSTNQKALNTIGVGHDEGTNMGGAFKKLSNPSPSWA